jgi:hypothetical protein
MVCDQLLSSGRTNLKREQLDDENRLSEKLSGSRFFSVNLTLWQQKSWARFLDRLIPFGRRRLANELLFAPMEL